mmetsp:Transcript_59254/g.158583  ORF Transcript_59254/g.158583 Transcript_59254/m.158583 type:complete len:448 (+) Transcript_59254:1017-2360(+)
MLGVRDRRVQHVQMGVDRIDLDTAHLFKLTVFHPCGRQLFLILPDCLVDVVELCPCFGGLRADLVGLPLGHRRPGLEVVGRPQVLRNLRVALGDALVLVLDVDLQLHDPGVPEVDLTPHGAGVALPVVRGELQLVPLGGHLLHGQQERAVLALQGVARSLVLLPSPFQLFQFCLETAGLLLQLEPLQFGVFLDLGHLDKARVLLLDVRLKLVGACSVGHQLVLNSYALVIEHLLLGGQLPHLLGPVGVGGSEDHHTLLEFRDRLAQGSARELSIGNSPLQRSKLQLQISNACFAFLLVGSQLIPDIPLANQAVLDQLRHVPGVPQLGLQLGELAVGQVAEHLGLQDVVSDLGQLLVGVVGLGDLSVQRALPIQGLLLQCRFTFVRLRLQGCHLPLERNQFRVLLVALQVLLHLPIEDRFMGTEDGQENPPQAIHQLISVPGLGRNLG